MVCSPAFRRLDLQDESLFDGFDVIALEREEQQGCTGCSDHCVRPIPPAHVHPMRYFGPRCRSPSRHADDRRSTRCQKRSIEPRGMAEATCSRHYVPFQPGSQALGHRLGQPDWVGRQDRTLQPAISKAAPDQTVNDRRHRLWPPHQRRWQRHRFEHRNNNNRRRAHFRPEIPNES